MKQDLEATKAYYGAQDKDGQFPELGGSTDVDTVVALLKPHENEIRKVIDLGCGNGHVAEALLAQLKQIACYIGIEPQPDLAAEARKRNPKMSVLEMDARNFGIFEQAGFDVVLCLFLLQDMCGAEGTEILECVGGVLRKDGLLLLGLSVHPNNSQPPVEGWTSSRMKNRHVSKLMNTWGKPELTAELTRLNFSNLKCTSKQSRGALEETYWLLRVAA